MRRVYAPPPLTSPASALVSGSRLLRVEPERAADVLPRRPMSHGGARQPPGDLVELIDGGANLGKRAHALIGRAGLRIDRGNGTATPSRKLSLDEASEIGRDRDALGKRGLAKSTPLFVGDRNAGDL